MAAACASATSTCNQTCFQFNFFFVSISFLLSVYFHVESGRVWSWIMLIILCMSSRQVYWSTVMSILTIALRSASFHRDLNDPICNRCVRFCSTITWTIARSPSRLMLYTMNRFNDGIDLTIFTCVRFVPFKASWHSTISSCWTLSRGNCLKSHRQLNLPS